MEASSVFPLTTHTFTDEDEQLPCLLFTRQQLNLESHQIVWLDDDCSANATILQRLGNIVDYVRLFDNYEQCCRDVEETQINVIIFICSAKCGEQILPRVHNCKNIRSVYIYCHRNDDTAHVKRWAMNYSKITQIYAQVEDVQKDLSRNIETALVYDLFNPTNKPDNTTDDFLSWWTEFIDFLCFLSYSKDHFSRLVRTLKVYYSGDDKYNEAKRREVYDFETNYKSEDSIKWYTRPNSFVSRIINHALRHQNIEILFLFGFFVRDMYQQLDKEHNPDMTLTVYRSQIILKEEIDRLAKPYAKYVVNKSFLSTSLTQDLVEMYHDRTLSRNDKLQNILYEIEINSGTTSRPFSDISRLSYVKDESELLFMPGTRFQRMHISDAETKEFWILKLKLQHNSNSRYQRESKSNNLINYINKLLPHFLYRALPKDRNLIFDKLIDLFPSEKSWLLAAKAHCLALYQDWTEFDYTAAIASYTQALDLWREFMVENKHNDEDAYVAMGQIYYDLGNCYGDCEKLQDLNLAEENYNHSIELYRSVLAIHFDRIFILNRLSDLYELKHNCSNNGVENILSSIQYQEEALESIAKEKDNQLLIADRAQRLARLYELVDDYGKAITAYEMATEMYLSQSELDLYSLISLHRSIATIYSKHLKNYSLAIDYQLRMHHYITQKYQLKPEADSQFQIYDKKTNIGKSHVELAEIYTESNDYTTAREHLNIALNLYRETEQEWQPNKNMIKNIEEKIKNMS